MNKIETLSEASKLVSSGMHGDAIDLLLKYLDTKPNSQAPLHILGQAYILEDQPDQAAIYLKKTLEMLQGDSTGRENTQKYHPENFDDDDMVFVESEAKMFAEEDYKLDADESDGNNIWEDSSNSISHVNEESNHLIPPDTNKGSVVEETNRLATAQGNSRTNDSPPDLALGKEIVKSEITDESHQPDQQGDENLILIDNEQSLPDDLLEADAEGQEEETLDELANSDFPIPGEEIEEPGWDEFEDFEDLEDFDELANRGSDAVQHQGRISREVRAKQMAVGVLDKWNWDEKHLPLLQQIFEENGWGRARVAIEEQMENGIHPGELALARKIRRLWLSTDQFWVTFQFTGRNDSFRQTGAFYKSISWPETVRIIRCFPSLPDIEEIYWFIDEVFEHWYNSDNLRKIFPSFLLFLKYRVEAIHQALPGETAFSFLYYFDASSDVDADRFNDSLFNEDQERRLLMGLDELI